MYVRNHFWRRIVANLKKLPASKWREILDKIQEQLSRQPIRETRNKKILEGLQPPWKHRQPMWELRVGEYRVFYDVAGRESGHGSRAAAQTAP
jgi:mRNA-degrading endonuclease RelE of RelBE toxin-antitoxin system